MKPIANLIHVGDVKKALRWYQEAFPEASVVEELGFTFLMVGEFALELVPSDEKVSSGKSGSITYWSVSDLIFEIERFQELGADVYRGPMKIGNDLGMCQVEDPWGNLIGLRGPFNYNKHNDS